jgi:hypothetical protein
VWAGALELDRRLAEGVWPSNSPELMLRARQLGNARARRRLSGALIEAAAAARRAPAPWTPRVPIAAPGVREATRALERLAQDLATIREPRIRGIALASYLVCDPGSPIYDRHAPVTVGEIAERARSALEPR